VHTNESRHKTTAEGPHDTESQSTQCEVYKEGIESSTRALNPIRCGKGKLNEEKRQTKRGKDKINGEKAN